MFAVLFWIDECRDRCDEKGKDYRVHNKHCEEFWSQNAGLEA